MKKEDIWFCIMVITILTGFVGGLVYIFRTQATKVNAFINELETLDIEITNAVVDSPSLILPVDRNEFIELAKEKGLVYRDYNKFYVFSDDLQVAYRYNVYTP